MRKIVIRLTKVLAVFTPVTAGGLGDTYSCKYLQERLNFVNGYQDICPAQFLTLRLESAGASFVKRSAFKSGPYYMICVCIKLQDRVEGASFFISTFLVILAILNS